MYQIKRRFLVSLFLFSVFAQAQIDGDSVRIRRKVVIKAKETVKVEKVDLETPNIEDIRDEVKEVDIEYEIQDVFLDSDFDLSSIEAERVQLDKIGGQDGWSYIRAAYGLGDVVNGEIYLSGRVDNIDNFGIRYSHWSNLGKVNSDRYNWDTQSYHNDFEAFADANFKKSALNTKIGIDFLKYNYYGIGNPKTVDVGKLAYGYDQIYLGFNYDHFKSKVFDKAQLNAHRLADDLGTVEYQGDFSADVKYDFPSKKDFKVGVLANAGVDYVNTDFNGLVEYIYQNLVGDITPQIRLDYKFSNLIAGAKVQMNQLDVDGVSKTETTIYPVAELFISPIKEIGLYAGITGGTKVNAYHKSVDKNPYLYPDHKLRPTETKQHYYVGLRGDIAKKIKYDVQVFHKEKNNYQFFKKVVTDGNKPYSYTNSFGSVYDNGTIEGLSALVRFSVFNDLSITAQGAFHQFDFEQYKSEPIGLAELTAQLDVMYKLLESKLVLGLTTYYVGDRPREYSYTDTTGVDVLKEMPSFIDVNLKASYEIKNNWTVYLEGLNLIGDQYEEQVDYEVIGRQIRGGFFFKF